MFVWEAVDTWRLWWLPQFLVDLLDCLDFRVPLGDDNACLRCDVLLLWRSVNWATVNIDVPKSKDRNISPGSSGDQGDYVWVDPSVLTIVSAETEKHRRASAHPSNQPGGATLDNAGGSRTFDDLETDDTDTFQGLSASTVEVISISSGKTSPTRDPLDIDQITQYPNTPSPLPN